MWRPREGYPSLAPLVLLGATDQPNFTESVSVTIRSYQPDITDTQIFQLKRLIRARRACGLSAREIAKELELPIYAVREVLE